MRRLLAITLITGFFGSAAATPVISDAWIRALPNNLPAGGYFTVTNPDAKPITLIGAQSPACSSLMLHMTHNMNGMEHMMAVEKIDIAAGGKFTFKPGGYHLMCLEPKNLKPGTTIAVILKFSTGNVVESNFAVKNATGN